MTTLLKMRIWSDQKGQDLIEYAMLAGFIAVAAGAVLPGVAVNVSRIFSKLQSSLSSYAA